MLKSPCASNQARPRRNPGRARRSPASAPACEVQSPPRTSSRASGPAASRPAVTWAARRGRYASRRSRFFIRGSGSAAQPGSFEASPWSCHVVPARPGEPQVARSGRVVGARQALFHTREVAAECGRRARDHDGCAIGHTRRIRTRRVRHDAAMRIADFALERYFARWEFGRPPAVRFDVRPTRWASCLRWRTTSRGPCGTT